MKKWTIVGLTTLLTLAASAALASVPQKSLYLGGIGIGSGLLYPSDIRCSNRNRTGTFCFPSIGIGSGIRIWGWGLHTSGSRSRLSYGSVCQQRLGNSGRNPRGNGRFPPGGDLRETGHGPRGQNHLQGEGFARHGPDL